MLMPHPVPHRFRVKRPWSHNAMRRKKSHTLQQYGSAPRCFALSCIAIPQQPSRCLSAQPLRDRFVPTHIVQKHVRNGKVTRQRSGMDRCQSYSTWNSQRHIYRNPASIGRQPLDHWIVHSMACGSYGGCTFLPGGARNHRQPHREHWARSCLQGGKQVWPCASKAL